MKSLKHLLPDEVFTANRIKFNNTEYDKGRNFTFISCADDINQQIHNNGGFDVFNKVNYYEFFEMFQIIETNDLKNIKRMPKSGGGIMTKILVDAFRVVENHFFDVINTFLRSSVFHNEWKNSMILSVTKAIDAPQISKSV